MWPRLWIWFHCDSNTFNPNRFISIELAVIAFRSKCSPRQPFEKWLSIIKMRFYFPKRSIFVSFSRKARLKRRASALYTFSIYNKSNHLQALFGQISWADVIIKIESKCLRLFQCWPMVFGQPSLLHFEHVEHKSYLADSINKFSPHRIQCD